MNAGGFMIDFSKPFRVEATATSGRDTNWTAHSHDLPPIPSAIPPEFMGPGKGYSPEDLFGIAVTNCLIATYKVYCEKGKVTFANIHVKTDVKLKQNHGAASFHISNVDLDITVTGASDVDQATKLLDAAIDDCAVSNSIKSSKTFKKSVS